ncbi:hypothetical protein ACFL0S_00590 [Thermodesulfobacteriota bacterium]
MTQKLSRIDSSKILAGLKPFQRDTVEYVFDRLYLSENGSDRFLVADEVGLGKTLVARGVIAKAIEHLWERVERIDVVYICSNRDIARQNINRLNVTGKKDFAHASRLTLLPIALADFDEKLNFISFTPGTSFDLKYGTGIYDERILLFHLLREGWGLQGACLYNVLQCGVNSRDKWRQTVNFADWAKNANESISESFFDNLEKQCSEENRKGIATIRDRFEEICERFSYYKIHSSIKGQDTADRNQVIGELREILAKTCLKKLEPDLVILDEFQRFKDLLDENTEQGLLAKELFNYSDESTDVRTLLLSATPYKMYTMYEELHEDDHYTDFISTLKFLENDSDRMERLKETIENYRRAFYRFNGNDLNPLKNIKHDLEKGLRRTMVRTERLAYANENQGMLRDAPQRDYSLSSGEVLNYVSLYRIARELDLGDMVEYWKSAPYLLNFMDKYQLKQRFIQKIQNMPQSRLFNQSTSNGELFLSWREIEQYQQIDPRNAKLSALIDQMLDSGIWKLLWMPATLPYYEPSGPYAEADSIRLTKRLIFSSWTVVPKVISALLSYEVERRIFRSFKEQPVNTKEERKKMRPLLRFSVSNERLTGMPVLGLLYPSISLAKLGDPLHLLSNGEIHEHTRLLKVDEATSLVAGEINRLLDKLPVKERDSSQEDESWYWAAPILLDIQHDYQAAYTWLNRWNLASIWAGSLSEEDAEGSDSRWAEHVKKAVELLAEGTIELGRKPKDLQQVLAQTAIGGPAVCLLRAFSRAFGGDDQLDHLITRDQAGIVSWGFRKLFNQPEVMALIRGMDRSEPYWRRVLEYCVAGNLQSVLDEYSHVLREYLGATGLPPDAAIKEIATAMHAALSLKTSRVEVDDFRFSETHGSFRIISHNLRNHFALRFGDQKVDGSYGVTREDHVRTAFNSPFWPFVLASTSRGQEGLDFHLYCHALTHWNLPSNPVDMEQREGRIHRYKGHAVRKNLALLHHQAVNRTDTQDPWWVMFDSANRETAGKHRGLVPFWSYPVKGGAKIERHVPSLPLSRDVEKLDALRRALVVYRMVFGQNRQEDMVSFLLDKIPSENMESISEQLQIYLGPPKWER